jgi:poly(3-hydroxybutyrate) depolymerase
VLLGCDAASSSDSGPSSLSPGWHEISLDHDDLARRFRVYVPPSLPDDAPIVVLLHGLDASQRRSEPLPNRNPDDGSRVVCGHYPATADPASVQFCRMEGGGHAMPSIAHPLPRRVERFLGPQNHDVEGTRRAWTFLRRQR